MNDACLIAAQSQEEILQKLFLASSKGDLKTLRQLIHANADVNAFYQQRSVAICFSGLKRHEEVLHPLLKSLYFSLRERLDADIARAWEVAIEFHNLFNQRFWARNLNIYGETPLMRAVVKGHQAIVRALIEAKAKVNILSQEKGTALICGAIEGHKEIVQILIEAEADLDMNIYQDLIFRKEAIKYHQDAAERLLEDTVATGDFYVQREVPLLLAVIKEHKQIIYRLRQGIDGTLSPYGNTALIYAAMKGHQEIVQKLLNAGANINILSSDGQSALCYAIVFYHKAVIQQLLTAGAGIIGMGIVAYNLLKLIPDGLRWIALLLSGFNTKPDSGEDYLDTIENNELRNSIKRVRGYIEETFNKLIGVENVNQDASKIIRALQCIRYFIRMVKVKSAYLANRENEDDKDHLKRFLLMKNDEDLKEEDKISNASILQVIRKKKIPDEVLLLIRQSILTPVILNTLDSNYRLTRSFSELLYNRAQDPKSSLSRFFLQCLEWPWQEQGPWMDQAVSEVSSLPSLKHH